MNDTIEDRLLADHLHRLADGVPVPTTPTDQDVRRGRGRLRRRRAVATIGSAAAVVAIAAGGFALADGPADRQPDKSPVAKAPADEAPVQNVDPKATREDQLATLLAFSGQAEGTFTITSLTEAIEAIDDRMGGAEVLWTAVGRGKSWEGVGADQCPTGWTCESVTVDGLKRAQWASRGTVGQLAIESRTDVLVLTVNSVQERATDLAFTTP